MHNDIKIITCDIDNTIIPAGMDAISPMLKEAFSKAEEKGIHVVINSGRHYTFLQPSLFRDLRMDYIATINGGCLVKRDGTVVDKWPMSEKTMDELTNLCIKNGIGLGFKFEDAVVTYANHDVFVDGYCNKATHQDLLVINDDDSRSHHLKHGLPLGTFIIGEENIIEPFVNSIPELTFAWSSKRGYDVFLKSINKATIMEPLMKIFGCGWENVIAFGDAGNDTPMIKAAGIGVALGNAKDDAREYADYVADTCANDGVAKALYDLGIIA